MQTLMYITFIAMALVIQKVSSQCTPCDSNKKPADFKGNPAGLTICQPGDLEHCKDNNFGLYRHVVVKELCKKIESHSCVDLNDLKSEEDKKVLKWSRNAWAGRALVPPGLVIKTYGNYNCHNRRFISTAEGGHEGARWNFWQFHYRAKSFKMSLMEGYECSDGVVQMKVGSANRYSFEEVVGEWKPRGGGGAQLSLTATKSWGQTNTRAISDAFTKSISVAVSVGFDESNSVTTTASAGFSHSVTNTLAQMKNEARSVTCSSPRCIGRLYQWTVSATMLLDKKHTPGKQIVEECRFVCVPSSLPNHIGPKCPAGYCGDLEAGGGCQCCNSNFVKNGKAKLCEVSKPEL